MTPPKSDRTKAEIAHKSAVARFNKAKAALDGTPKAEVRYQKAKRDMVATRKNVKAWHGRVDDGDAVAVTVPLKVGSKVKGT